MRTWTHTEGRACEDTGRGRVHTPGREASGGTGPAHTCISAVQPPGRGQINVCVLSYQVWGPLWLPEQRHAPPVVTYIPQVIKNVCSQTPGYGQQAVSC